jgi:DNA-binding transcriptional regulator YhcF (GntR family)
VIIDRNSAIPIYAQLKEQIKFAIETGQFVVGDRLPTVRQHAVDLKINLNTVRKVYSELEYEGYISTRQVKGTFVTGVPERQDKDEQRITIINELLENLLVQAYALGFTAGEILVLLQLKVNSDQKGRHGDE